MRERLFHNAFAEAAIQLGVGVFRGGTGGTGVSRGAGGFGFSALSRISGVVGGAFHGGKSGLQAVHFALQSIEIGLAGAAYRQTSRQKNYEQFGCFHHRFFPFLLLRHLTKHPSPTGTNAAQLLVCRESGNLSTIIFAQFIRM
jgi:hypothetical protein